MTYDSVDIFLVCFSLDNQDSLHNIADKWIPEIIQASNNRNIRMILVQTKSDLKFINPDFVQNSETTTTSSPKISLISQKIRDGFKSRYTSHFKFELETSALKNLNMDLLEEYIGLSIESLKNSGQSENQSCTYKLQKILCCFGQS